MRGGVKANIKTCARAVVAAAQLHAAAQILGRNTHAAVVGLAQLHASDQTVLYPVARVAAAVGPALRLQFDPGRCLIRSG